MKLNLNKCKTLTTGHPRTLIDYKYGFRTLSGFEELERVNSIKDLGVTFDSELLFKDHIYDKVNTAYQMIGIISRNFKELDKYTFTMLYKSMVRSYLEYANSVGVRKKRFD